MAFTMPGGDGSNCLLAHMPGGDQRYFDSGSFTGRVSVPTPTHFLATWHHVALQVDSQAQAMHIFLDGQLLVASDHPHTYKPRATDFLIGFDHRGRLGEFRLWNYVRTPAEIRAEMPRVFAAFCPGLFGCQPLDAPLSACGGIPGYGGCYHSGMLNYH
ncbi:hypothetical protein GCM10027422_43530 [Hymenobacter arcticus]